MSKYIFIIVFYALSGIIIRVMNQKFTGAHDSGIGLRSLCVLLFYIAIVILIILNVYRYFQGKDGQYLIPAGIHLVMLLLSSRFVSWITNGLNNRSIVMQI